jgi:hypothetical protein
MPPARFTSFVAVPLLAATLGLARADGWTANPSVVASAAKGRPGINFEEAAVPPYTLPAVLPPDANIRTPEAWRARRADILDLFRDDVYGWSPGRPERLEFERVLVDPTAMSGAATLERVTVISRQADRSHRFTFTLFLPNARQPAPVFLLLNNRAASNVDPTRAQKSGFWPAEDLIARGYGIAALQNNDLAPDDKAHFTEGVIRLFEGDRTSRSPHGWGALGAWAWGASRVMDYLETDPRVDASRVAVLGHSRGGKAALWAGAQDQRFALVISNESGEGGAALARRTFGETVKAINDVFPHWFDATYKTYNDRVKDLPVDQHMLLSLIAPRALYVASADEDLWSDPRGEFESLAASSPVFELYGDPAIAPDAMPPLEQPLVVGRRGYHIRRGEHNLTPYDWARFADFADHLGWKQ